MEMSLSDDEVYITGVSGAFPESHSVYELQKKLFDKVDLITDDDRRWKHQSDAPKRTGKIFDIEKFDASFFDIHHKRAHVMDPVARILHEKVYEAIVDAGYNPSELCKFKVGVYFGYTLSETEQSSGYLKQDLHENGLTSCSRSMMATNISQWLGVSGPSYNVDTACSSSAYAIEHAIKSIQEGRCDMAIAGGANSCQIPHVSVNFNRLGVLSQDGRCKSFDNKANGYCRSEAVGVVVLQKAKHSRRVYASVVHAKANCDGFKEQGITYPASSVQQNLFKSFYEECGISPSDVEYIEAHGTGTKVGDPEELRAIDEVFCKGRNEPLLIGSIKSNMGHSEAGAGICSLTKLIIAYHSGYIPPNINFTEYREGVAGFEEGRLKVVTEKSPWSRGLAGFNAFGFGGSNVHVLLKDVAREKVNKGLPVDDLPRLVCVSGRTRSAVAKILDHLESKPVDVEEVGLWHAIQACDIPKHPYRGYVLLGSIPTKTKISRSIKHYKNIKYPVWFLYFGIEFQRLKLTRSLMKIPVFANAVQKCQKILQNNNETELAEILSDHNSNDYSNMLNCVVTTIAVHIALTEALKAVEIKPVHVIGHGIGKLSSAYAKGTLTIEQAILGACYVGKALDRNGRLTDSAGQLLKELEIMMTSQCAESIVNDLKGPRTLHEILKDIPLNTIVVKVSSGMQMQQKTTKNEESILVSVNQKEDDGVDFMLKSLGGLFLMGLNLNLANIYPHVQFPVARGTSMLSHLIGWNHNEDWFVYKLSALDTVDVQEKKMYVDLKNDDQVYLAKHVIDGRDIYPATGYIVMVWKTLASILKQEQSDVSVVFENISLNRATTIPKTGSLEFTVSLHKESGNFEVYEGGTAVVTGRVFAEENPGTKYRVIPDTQEEDKIPYPYMNLTAKDFYKELNLRGYQHKGLFRGVIGCNTDGTRGRVIWNDNWVSFLDIVFQPKIINHDTRGLYLPTRIEKLSIDVQMHNEILEKYPGLVKSLEFRMNPVIGVIRAGGVEVRGIHVTNISTKPPFGIPIYEKYVFIPNIGDFKILIFDALRINIQIVFENISSLNFKCVELIDEEYKKYEIEHVITSVGEILADMPLLKPDLHVITEVGIKLPSSIKISSKDNYKESNIILFIGANLLNRVSVLLEIMDMLRDGCFVLSREKTLPKHPPKSNVYEIVTIYETDSEYVILLRKKTKPKVVKCVRIVSSDETFSWINQVRENIEMAQKLVLYGQNESVNGLLGLVNCLRREPGGENACALLIADPRAPEFNPNLEFYYNQLDKDLAFNIYQEGKWGTYRHLLIQDTRPVSSPHAFVNITTTGDLSSLRWIQGPINPTSDVYGSFLMHVYSSGINFRDVMVALGRVSRDAVAIGRIAQECVFGIEASGKTANGSRITTICEKGISNITCIKKSLIIPIPDEWTFQEAATIPVAYSTAYTALVLIGKARSGESILIHAGSGGVGQAAISVALHLGLEVFTTVGTISKRKVIKKLYPQLKESHIGNSRDKSFEYMIQRETNGRGVDLVLNSLADEKLQASLRCLAHRGRFLEIGKFDITINTAVEMYLFHNEISFHGIMLDYILETCCSKLRKNLQKLIISGIASGAVHPLTNCSFDKNQTERAFRYMAAGKHVGKVIVKIRDEDLKSDTLAKPTSINMDAIPRYLCEGNGVYVLVGGLGGFGLELADWLVMRGARKLLICSRRGITNGYQAMRIRIWHSYGVNIKISTLDITKEHGCAEMLNTAKSMGSIKAVFNLAVVINDAVFQNQTQESFQRSYEPKALISIHLDKLTRILCPELKNFVLFSSASCGRGNSGQTNYGFSNAVMERICEIRRKDGFPALAIQWGAIGDVGFVADQQEDNNQVEISGTLQQKIVSCLEAVDKFLTQDEAAIVSSIVVAEKRFGGGLYSSSASAVAIIMGIKDLKTISHQTSLAELGMDSIMAVEIKQTLEREFEIYLTAQEIRNLCFSKLMEYDADKTKETDSDLLSEVDKKDTTQRDKNTIDLILKSLGDEKSVSQDLVSLPTLINHRAQKDALNNVPTLFMMSGIENCASTLTTLCSKLKCRACVLQLGLEHPGENLDQMADRLYPILKSHLSPGTPFYLLGYSFGSAVQLKLAAKLENEGQQGLVICVDCGPDFLTYIANSVVPEEPNNFDQNDLQSAIIEKILNSTVSRADMRKDIAKEIQKHKSFGAKVRAAIEKYPAHINYSEKYMIDMLAAIYHRIKVIINYANEKQSDLKLKSQIILIRSQILPVVCSEDFGLSLVCKGDVKVCRLDEDHQTIIDSDECAEIVNKAIINVEEKGNVML